MHEADAERRDDRDDRRADVVVRAAQIRDDDAGERGVRDAVADERELAQHDVRAHRRAQQPDGQRGDEGALHERVVKRREERVEVKVISGWWRAPRAARDRAQVPVRVRVLANRGVRARFHDLARRADARARAGRATSSRSNHSSTRSRSCVVMSTGSPPATSPRTTSRSASSVAASTPVVGSSSSSSLRLLRDRARDEDALLLAAGEIARCAGRASGSMSTALERVRDDLAIVLRRNAARSAAAEIAPSRRRPTRSPETTNRRLRPAARRRSSRAAACAAACRARAARRSSAAAARRSSLSSVDFPEPFGPMMPSASPKCTVERRAVERGEVVVAHDEVARARPLRRPAVGHFSAFTMTSVS